MSMTKMICSLHWTPVEPLKKHLEANKDLIMPVFGGGKDAMKLCNNEWVDNHAIADDCCADNISVLNPILNELTALYLVYKNLRLLDGHTANIGLCHYRRFFPVEALKHIDKCDGIVANPIRLGVVGMPVTIEKQYELCHCKEDFEVLRQTIEDEGLLDEHTWNVWKNLDVLFAPCNMFVLKREVFNMFCKDLFKVALKLPKKIDVSRRDDYQKRACSFLCERFTSYWMFSHCYKDQISLLGTNIEEHLDWKPKDSGDARGSYAGVFKGDESFKKIDAWLKHFDDK